MIVDIFLALLQAILQTFIFFLPTYSLPTDITDSVAWFFNSMVNLNSVFPVYALITAFGILLAFYFTLAVVRILAGLWSFVRGGGNLDV